jgi:hypothetical protein
VRKSQQTLATGGVKMSFIDVAIPAIIGLVALIRPQIMFSGSRATPNEKKIRVIRSVGLILLAVALIYLCIKLAVA